MLLQVTPATHLVALRLVRSSPSQAFPTYGIKALVSDQSELRIQPSIVKLLLLLSPVLRLKPLIGGNWIPRVGAYANEVDEL